MPPTNQSTILIAATSLMLTAGSLSQSSKVWRLIRRTIYTVSFGMMALVLWSQMVPQAERAKATSPSFAPAASSVDPASKLTPLQEVIEQNQIELKNPNGQINVQ